VQNKVAKGYHPPYQVFSYTNRQRFRPKYAFLNSYFSRFAYRATKKNSKCLNKNAGQQVNGVLVPICARGDYVRDTTRKDNKLKNHQLNPVLFEWIVGCFTNIGGIFFSVNDLTPCQILFWIMVVHLHVNHTLIHYYHIATG
jgi:hypothetical protein